MDIKKISNKLVYEFLCDSSTKDLEFYSIRDNCGVAAINMLIWAEKKGVILKRHNGYFLADKVVYEKKDFTKEMKTEFNQKKLNFNNAKERKEFIENHPKYKEEWKKIPHYWLEDCNGNIYDPSGYFQFIKTKLTKDLKPFRYLKSSPTLKPLI